MADTIRGNFPDEICSDCGKKGVIFHHWGSRVPEGTTAKLCVYCWDRRAHNEFNGEKPKPLGVKPPGEPEEFKKRALLVETRSGSIYNLGVPNEAGERTVSCNLRKPWFSTCEILLLKIGENMWLRKDNEFWETTRVISITPI
jgi:hypothetical protein